MPSSDPPATDESSHPDTIPPTPTQLQPQAKSEGKKSPKPQEAPAAVEGTKLSGAELKKQKQAEKAARRAQTLQQKAAGPATPVAAPPVGLPQKADGAKTGKGHHKRGPSGALELRNLPSRGPQKLAPPPEEPKKEDKTVEFFRHLYKTRTTSMAEAEKEVHPAILDLGALMRSYEICGSCARLVATMQAFKSVGSSLLLDVPELMSVCLGHRILHNTAQELTYSTFHLTCPLSTNRISFFMSTLVNLYGECNSLAEVGSFKSRSQHTRCRSEAGPL